VGIEEVKWRGGHLYLAHPTKDLEMCVPMHIGDLGRDLIRAVIQEAGLMEEEFRNLL